MQNTTKANYANAPLHLTDAVITPDGAYPVLPHLRMPNAGQLCRVDWLNLTMCVTSVLDHPDRFSISYANQLSYRQDVIAKLSEDLQDILGFGIADKNARGRNCYEHSYNLDYSAGTVCIGGQNETVMLTLNGTGCTFAKDDWESALQFYLLKARNAKITRLDLCYDDLDGSTISVDWANTMDDQDGFSNGGRRPRFEQRGNWKRPDNKGRTAYIGSRKSSKYCRIYEKGKQLGDPNSQWVRCEVEYKNKHIYIPLETLVNPTPFFLASYPCFEQMDEQDTPRKKFERIKRTQKLTFEQAMEITKHQFGRYINAFRDVYADDNALLNELTDINNKHYPERLNVLTIPTNAGV